VLTRDNKLKDEHARGWPARPVPCPLQLPRCGKAEHDVSRRI
jgi:hypothetical protein